MAIKFGLGNNDDDATKALKTVKSVVRKGKWVVLALGVLGMLTCSLSNVQTGNVGVMACMGKSFSTVHGEGPHIVGPCTMNQMSVRMQEYTMAGGGREGASDGAVSTFSKDHMSVLATVTVQFHLQPSEAVNVFRTLGPNYDHVTIHPLVRAGVRDAAAEFNALELLDERVRVQHRMETVIRERVETTLANAGLNRNAVTISNIIIREVLIPSQLTESITAIQVEIQRTALRTQERQTADQQRQAMLVRVDGENQALERTAAAQARANRELAASITPQLIQLRQVESLTSVLSNNNTRTMIVPMNSPLVLPTLPSQQ